MYVKVQVEKVIFIWDVNSKSMIRYLWTQVCVVLNKTYTYSWQIDISTK